MATNYLNNAGASILSDTTLEIVQQFYEQEMKEGAYSAANNVKAETESFYNLCAELINAESKDNIAFMDSASRAWNTVIYGLDLNESSKLITLSTEFGTNLITLYHRSQTSGCELSIIDCDLDGSFALEKLETELDSNKKCIVAISQAAAHGSIVNPVCEIGELCAQRGATYVVDGCQSVGQMEVDVQKMKCHAFTATGRKWLRGPRGTGFVYIRENGNINVTGLDLAAADLILENGSIQGIQLRTDARKFELWERSIANVLGLKNAIKEHLSRDRHSDYKSTTQKARQLRLSIKKNGKLSLIGKVDSPSAVVGFYANDVETEKKILEAFTSSEVKFSQMHDWDCPLDFQKYNINSIFRLSPHYYTEKNVIELALNIIENI